ncbi:uncharacterized protein LOC129922767 isoform X2 [Biomphalaria glabrata]|uniref:Uncharacterized protein LOC129922767 isoform X2 n=1 Tax=Biomphalaria glabrata TaxID=6526 RepID=A0A9W2YSU0_BIOGL|nr:uncharacterized protein LOC129922767 isoform X2 [Biomphalaria glabrata]
MFSILVFLKYLIVHSAAQQPIVNSTQHDIGDTFNITCDVKRFANLKEITSPDHVYNMSLHRKSFLTLTSIPLVVYVPSADFLYIDNEIKSNILVKHNPRNQWLFHRTGGIGFANRRNIQFIVTAVNFQCSDAGEYYCIIVLPSGKFVSTSPVNITVKAPISDHKIKINRHNRNDSYSSTNYVGENITLTCTVTGPPSLLITWNQTAKGSTKENPATGEISSNSTSESVVSAGCKLHHYSSKLVFELQETYDGNTYYCIVSNDTGEQSRENFTLRIIPYDKHESEA